MNDISGSVRKIISDVQKRGDAALCELSKRFDRISLRPSAIAVSQAEIRKAKSKISASFQKSINECAKNIEAFARQERKRITASWLKTDGSMRVGQLIRPVDSVGLYIPGGRFPYPSTVLMSAIPARVAGVQRIVMASPAKNLTPEV